MNAVRRSALSILREMPPVFDMNGLCRLADISRPVAKTYVSRWARAGHIRPAGPRAGIYYNLVTSPNSPSEQAANALLLEYPSAILCGASVLHAAGWTTQIPARTTVAVLVRPSYVRIDGFDVTARPRSWFEATAEAISRDEELASFGLRSLTPAMALADAFFEAFPGRDTDIGPEQERSNAWQPDPDDLDLDDAEPGEIESAFEMLGIELPEELEDVVPSGAGCRRP